MALAPRAPSAAHASHDYGESVGSKGAGNGTKQDIDGGAAGVFGHVLVHTEPDEIFVPVQKHVVVAGSDPDVAGFQRHAGASLAHDELGFPVQMLGQQVGKQGRHVLHDHNRHGKAFGQQGNH